MPLAPPVLSAKCRTVLSLAAVFTLAGAMTLAPAYAAPAAPSPLATVAVEAARADAGLAIDGVVEAVRQAVVASQVAGAVVQIQVKAGDRVSAGQVLMRLDARAAEQGAAASDAQVQAARVQLELATQEVTRQRNLHAQRFISQAALDQAESAFKGTQAQLSSQLAQAAGARTQSSLHIVRAPFAGLVSEVPVSLGDMALPGRPLLTVYDPSELRVVASAPQTAVNGLAPGFLPRLEFPGAPTAQQALQPTRAQVLPVIDPGTHTVLMRADLPVDAVARFPGVVPGLSVRLWLPTPASSGSAGQGLSVPFASVVRRAELTAVYVLSADGQPLLRQVRLGRRQGERVEVLAGLNAGERVVLDALAATRLSTPASQAAAKR
jgi:RND family efflux transporter MFP subunit